MQGGWSGNLRSSVGRRDEGRARRDETAGKCVRVSDPGILGRSAIAPVNGAKHMAARTQPACNVAKYGALAANEVPALRATTVHIPSRAAI